MWVAAVQFNSTTNQEANLARSQALVEEAAARGAQLVALPEHFACLGTNAETAAAACPLDGPLVGRFRELSNKLKIFLLLGSFSESVPGKARPFNSSILMDPRGEIIAHYRKLHLFDVNLPNTPPYRESEWTHPGEEVVVAALPGAPFTVGLAVCYDLRFPELFRAMAIRGQLSSSCPRRLRQQPAGTTGKCCFGPGLLKTFLMSWRRPNMGSTRPASTVTAAL